MIKIYGSELCPDCRNFKKRLDQLGVGYEYIDINLNLRDLSDFLILRDSKPVFEQIRGTHTIGLPAFIREDGTVLLDWEAYLKELGDEPAAEEGESCSIDKKGC
jgi:glutaredoxin-related protein